MLQLLCFLDAYGSFCLCWRRSSVDLLTLWMPVCHLIRARWRCHDVFELHILVGCESGGIV